MQREYFMQNPFATFKLQSGFHSRNINSLIIKFSSLTNT